MTYGSKARERADHINSYLLDDTTPAHTATLSSDDALRLLAVLREMVERARERPFALAALYLPESAQEEIQRLIWILGVSR